VKRTLDECREVTIDKIENTLTAKAMEGEAWAVCFYMKTQAKHRGYVERQEFAGVKDQPLVVNIGRRADD
jgi:hypothetical protein